MPNHDFKSFSVSWKFVKEMVLFQEWDQASKNCHAVFFSNYEVDLKSYQMSWHYCVYNLPTGEVKKAETGHVFSASLSGY